MMLARGCLKSAPVLFGLYYFPEKHPILLVLVEV